MPRIRLILSFLLLSVLFSCNNKNSTSQENKLNSDQKIENPDEKKTSQKENKKITIIGVGDIMLGSNYPSKNLLPKNDYNILSHTEKILQDADITIGNLMKAESQKAVLIRLYALFSELLQNTVNISRKQDLTT